MGLAKETVGATTMERSIAVQGWCFKEKEVKSTGRLLRREDET